MAKTQNDGKFERVSILKNIPTTASDRTSDGEFTVDEGDGWVLLADGCRFGWTNNTHEDILDLINAAHQKALDVHLESLRKQADEMEKALELIHEKTITDPAGESELRARAASVFNLAHAALTAYRGERKAQ